MNIHFPPDRDQPADLDKFRIVLIGDRGQNPEDPKSIPIHSMTFLHPGKHPKEFKMLWEKMISDICKSFAEGREKEVTELLIKEAKADPRMPRELFKNWEL